MFYRVVAGDSMREASRRRSAWREDKLGERGTGSTPDGNLHPKMVLLAVACRPRFDAEAHKVALLDEDQLVVVTRGSPEHLDLAERAPGACAPSTSRRAKEKLADVAKKFGMGSHDLARINRISYDTVLDKGQTIIVYQVTGSRRARKRADEQWQKTPRARRGKVSTGAPRRADRVGGA